MALALACSKETTGGEPSAGTDAAIHSELPLEQGAPKPIHCTDETFGSDLSWIPTMPDRLLVASLHAQCDGIPSSVVYSFDLQRADAPLRFVLESKERQVVTSSIAIAAAPAGVFPEAFVSLGMGTGANLENAILRGGERVARTAPAEPGEGGSFRYCSVGDLDGDGRMDIGAALTRDPADPRSGSVRVLSGLEGGELLTLPVPPGGARPQFVFGSAGSGGSVGAANAYVYSLWSSAEHELSLRRNDRNGSLLNEIVVGRFETADVQAVLVSETREHSTVAVGFVTAESRVRARVFLVDVEDGRVDLLHEQISGQMGGPVRIADAHGSPSIVVALENGIDSELIRIDPATRRVVATIPIGRDEDGSGLIGQVLCAIGDVDGDGAEDLALSTWKLGAPFRAGTRVQLRSGLDLSILGELGPPQDEHDALPAGNSPAQAEKK